jgi:hypothetical protein
MTVRRLLCGLLIAGWTAAASAQTFTPQSASGLSVSFTTERAGGSRILVFGDVRNTTNAPAERVVILAEGLDESGRVVSRGRTYVTGTVPARGSAPFEVRLSASGSEKRYRVQVDAFEFFQGN